MCTPTIQQWGVNRQGARQQWERGGWRVRLGRSQRPCFRIWTLFWKQSHFIGWDQPRLSSTFMNSPQMFLIAFLSETPFLFFQQCYPGLSFRSVTNFFSLSFCLRYQVPYSLIATGPIFLMSHQPNSAQFHGHSISSTLFQNDHISHPVKCFKSSLKNKQIKINHSINPEHFCLFCFYWFGRSA